MRIAILISIGLFLVPTVFADTDPVRLKQFEQYAMTHAGDAARGKKLFHDQTRAKCIVCHRLGKDGATFGPELSKIGGKFDRIHLIESLLEPSAQIVYGFETSVILTTDGEVHLGVVSKESEETVVLEMVGKEEQTIRKDAIEERKVSRVSAMPADVDRILTKEEVADLVAYLETLQTGKASFGSGTKGPIGLPDGYQIDTLVTGLSGVTALETLDDGRVLICEQEGHLRVVKNGKLLATPMLTLDVEMYWERGLIGVTVDPDFPRQNWVYLCYVAKEPYTHHRISRFRVQGDLADPESEEILLKGDDQSKLGGHVPAGHQGGGIHFGNDGTLYVGIGEQTAKTPAQSMTSFQGKILRVNPDGSIPDDNPFLDQTSGKYRAIWAKGCRNPFTFAFDKRSGKMLINDVGGEFEEINPGVAGANYGWPILDHGPTSEEGYVGPIHHYPQASISGGDFAPENAGASVAGRYVFADFVHGWIHSIDPNAGGDSAPFVTGLRRPVDLRFAGDGALYVLLRNAWVVDDKFQSDSGSLVRIYHR